MNISEEFLEMIISKYEEMKEFNKTEDILSDKIGMFLFINIEPKIFLFKFQYDSDTLYVGSN